MPAQTTRNAPLPDSSPIESTFREVNDISLHVVTAGDPDDPLVILLHGYPEFWYQWSPYIGPLVDAGYRVLVPDQRGYNRSDKPAEVRQYRMPELSRDIVDLIETEPHEDAHVVGHDWGGAVAWDLGLRHSEVINRLSVINLPHPRAVRRTLRSNPTQLLKSWYIFFYQIPRLPEWVLSRNDFALLVAMVQKTAKPDAFNERDFERYRRAWSEPGALPAMINWYRALMRHPADLPRERIRAQTLIIWGENDSFLVSEMAPASLNYCDDGQLKRFPDATHWVTHEYPDRVTELLLDHFES